MVDDGIISSAGVDAGIDMAFYVVETLFGREVADETAHYIEYRRAGSEEVRGAAGGRAERSVEAVRGAAAGEPSEKNPKNDPAGNAEPRVVSAA